MMTPEELITFVRRQAHKCDAESEVWMQILDRLLILDKMEKALEQKKMEPERHIER